MFLIDGFYDQGPVVSNRLSLDMCWWGDVRNDNATKAALLFKAKPNDLFGPAAVNEETCKRFAAAVRKGNHIFAMLDDEVFYNSVSHSWNADDLRRTLDLLQPMLPEVMLLPTGAERLPPGLGFERNWRDEDRLIEHLERQRDIVERLGCAWFGCYLPQKADHPKDKDYGLGYALDTIDCGFRLINHVYGRACFKVAWCSTHFVFPEFAAREGIPQSEWHTLPREPVVRDDVRQLYAVLRRHGVHAAAVWGLRAGSVAYTAEI